MEDTAYALDDERFELLQELDDLKNNHSSHTSKQRNYENQLASLTRELQQWAQQKKELEKKISDTINDIAKAKEEIGKRMETIEVNSSIGDEIKKVTLQNDELTDKLFEMEDKLDELKSNSKRVVLETSLISTSLKKIIEGYNKMLVKRDTLIKLCTTLQDEEKKKFIRESLELIEIIPLEDMTAPQLNLLSEKK